ncbi:MAG: DUF4910 domain-containing protein [Pseudomonadota bacterium]
MHALAAELFPLPRSITGNGVRQTLARLAEDLPDLEVEEVPSGTRCFDWTVPPEWNVSEAHLTAPDGRRIADFAECNLHLLGYSEPVTTSLGLEELQAHLYSRPDRPGAIPYVTSYYKRNWGFCLTDNQRAALQPGQYDVVIDSTLDENGSLTYGELVVPATIETDAEVFLSTYVCHPSMANNELSGPVVATALFRWLWSLDERRYNYRIVFVPETIGAITYLSRNLDHLKKSVVAGFNISCVGDDRAYSYLPSRKGDTISDDVARHVLHHLAGDYAAFTFLDRGSDERQYCAPGVDLPIASVMRSKFGTYPEYHTSDDNLELVTAEGLAGGYRALRHCLMALEANRTYRATVLCEPQLSRHGLYPSARMPGDPKPKDHLNILAYADGETSLLQIAELLDQPIWDLSRAASQLCRAGLLEPV